MPQEVLKAKDKHQTPSRYRVVIEIGFLMIWPMIKIVLKFLFCLQKGNTALHIASLAGHEDIVKMLVEHEAKINVQAQVRKQAKTIPH